MMSFKRFFILIMAVVFVTVSLAAQQTVEQSYLQEAIEVMIIRETARMHTREQKLMALEYIGEALDRGNTNDEIRQTLHYLVNEGNRNNQARENGRLVNNFPDVRRQAARYLGQIATEEARVSLVGILMEEYEPMVVQEAIKSLGDIGTNEGNHTISNITWRLMKDIRGHTPDNLVALAAIDTFQKIAQKNNGIQDPEVFRALNLIADYRSDYVVPVRERARQVLAELRRYGS